MSALAIAFVAPFGEGALRIRAGLPPGLPFGGAEQQVALLAAGLADRGHRVWLLCAGRTRTVEEVRIGHVNALRLPLGSSSGATIQMTLRAGIERTGARFVYQRCALPLTGRLAWLCRRTQRRFIFAVANDRDLDGRARRVLGWSRYAMYRYGLSRADMVVVQTRAQERLLERTRARRALLLPSAMDLRGVPPRTGPADGPVLWVGNVLAKKRPMEFLRLARSLPGHRFLAAGDESQDPALARRFRAEAEQLSNVTLLGRVDHADLDALYRQASVLLNT